MEKPTAGNAQNRRKSAAVLPYESSGSMEKPTAGNAQNRRKSAAVLPYESSESMEEKTVQHRPTIDLAATNDSSNYDDEGAGHRNHKVLGVPKWAPQYIQTHADDADMYRSRERRESGPHDYSAIIKLQSEHGLFKQMKLFGGGGGSGAANAVDSEALPSPALKLAADAHIAVAAAAEEALRLENDFGDDEEDGWDEEPDTPDTVLTPDGKPRQGSLLRFSDEVGGVLEVVAYSENLHYSLRNLDYRMRVMPDGPVRGNCACTVS